MAATTGSPFKFPWRWYISRALTEHWLLEIVQTVKLDAGQLCLHNKVKCTSGQGAYLLTFPSHAWGVSPCDLTRCTI